MGQIAGTLIEWATHSWNPVPGRCWVGCEYCYALRYLHRFKKRDHPPILNEKELLWKPPAGSLVFAGSMIDLFHDKIPADWIQAIISQTEKHPDVWYAFLSKYPERMGLFDFPVNCLLGATWDGTPRTQYNLSILAAVVPENRIAYLSFEPMLANPRVALGITFASVHRQPLFDWVIAGGDSNPGAEKPPDWWADKLMKEADYYGIPFWLKDNFGYLGPREIPKERPIRVLWEERKNRRRKEDGDVPRRKDNRESSVADEHARAGT